MAEELNNPPLLELVPPELAVPLKVTHAGRTYRVRHLFRPPTAADWFAYEAALEMAVEELPPEHDADEPGFRLHVRSTDAALALWQRLIRRVEGYSLPAALESAGAAWQDLIPLAHKEAAVRALTLVAPAALPDPTDNPSTNNHFPLCADEVLIVLEAARAGRAYPRLAHRFRPPSVEHERAYRRLMAETLIVRGSRTPRTLIPARLPALVRLYDELILGVEGYAVNLQPPASRLQLLEHMDAWHKRVAIQTLFGDLAAEALPPDTATQADLPAAAPEKEP